MNWSAAGGLQPGVALGIAGVNYEHGNGAQRAALVYDHQLWNSHRVVSVLLASSRVALPVVGCVVSAQARGVRRDEFRRHGDFQNLGDDLQPGALYCPANRGVRTSSRKLAL